MTAFTRSEAKTWAQKQIQDFYVCPISATTADGTIDEGGLRENTEMLLDIGINGLVVGGFVAEAWNLTYAEWLRYHEVIAEVAAAGTDLWTIILDPCAKTAVEKLNFVENLGFSGAELINPIIQLRADDEIYDYFKYVTDRSDAAICLYRTPVSGKVMGLDLMKRLVDLETVVCVKQSNINRAETLMLRRELRDDFIVSDPFEYFYLQDLRAGGQVLWAELSYILYGKKRHLLKEYSTLARQGKWEEAYPLWEALRPAWELYEEEFLNSIARTGTYASAVGTMKAWCGALGYNAGRMMPPVRDLSLEHKERLIKQIKTTGVI